MGLLLSVSCSQCKWFGSIDGEFERRLGCRGDSRLCASRVKTQKVSKLEAWRARVPHPEGVSVLRSTLRGRRNATGGPGLMNWKGSKASVPDGAKHAAWEDKQFATEAWLLRDDFETKTSEEKAATDEARIETR